MTRPVPVELGGLAVMGTRRWRRSRPDTRDGLVAGSRPARLGDGEELFIDPSHLPGWSPPALLPDAAGSSSVVPSAVARIDALPPVLPGAVPVSDAVLASVPAMAVADHPAHLSAGAMPVISPPRVLVSDGSVVPSVVPPSAPAAPSAPAPSPPAAPSAPAPSAPAAIIDTRDPPVVERSRPVDLVPAIENLSPLADVIVVKDADPGSVHIDPIPLDDVPAHG